MVECIPLDDFVHGEIKARRGIPISVSDGTALDLERAGLVRIASVRNAHQEPIEPRGTTPNLPAAGVVLQSSVSPVAPASLKRTVISLKGGRGRTSVSSS